MNSPRTNRVLQILALVSASPRPTLLREITAALGVHPSMVSRMTADLIKAGLLAKTSYRSVIATPALALLGHNAAKNHPAAQVALPVLRSLTVKAGYSCEFATLTAMGLYHFFHVLRGTPAIPLWRSDCAAVCMAGAKKSWEECLEYLTAAGTPGQGFDFFRERFEAACQTRILTNRHGGRFWQVSTPVFCGELVCALSFAGTATADMEKAAFEAGQAADRIRSAYKDFAEGNA